MEQQEQQIDETVEKIMKIINWFNKLDPNPDAKGMNFADANMDRLTVAATALATYKVYLGDFIANLSYWINFADAEQKQFWTTRFFEHKKAEEKVSDTVAKAKADQDVHEQGLEIIEKKLQYDRLKNLRQDVSDLITTIQTRVSSLKREQTESTLPGR